MEVTLIATAMAPDANSNCTVAEADTYHHGHLYAAAWFASDQKAKALITATRILDEQCVWVGWAYTSVQRLRWPRSGVPTRNRWRDEFPDIVPDPIKDATAEFARVLIEMTRLPNQQAITPGTDVPLGLTALTAGPVSLAWDTTLTSKPVEQGTIPPNVWSMLTGYVVMANQFSGTRELYRA